MKNLIKVLLTLLTTSYAYANQPISVMSQYQIQVGKWDCQATWQSTDSTPRLKTSGTYEAHYEVDGTTLVEHYQEDLSVRSPNPYKLVNLITYDPNTRKFKQMGVNETGLSWAVESDGWVNGVARIDYTGVYEIIKMIGPEMDAQLFLANGNVLLWETICSKRKSRLH